MSEYQLEIKQIVDYPRCRIYRQFVQSLINDRSIRISGGSGLFCFTVLCSYANFRTSYRRIDGISYTVYPGEWIVTTKELAQWFRTRFYWQAIEILEKLQKMHLLSFISLNRGKVIKYRITDWRKHNTVLDYNCPCQKDTGFFFMPLSPAAEIISTERCSEMDIVLDLWLSTVYNDTQVQGSEVGPVVYLRNGTTFCSNSNSRPKKMPVTETAPPAKANRLKILINKGIKRTPTMMATLIGVYGMMYLG